MNAQEIYYVHNSIEAVVARFQRTPNVFLTEDDLRVHLCSNLLKYFGAEQPTQDGDRSISLHAEVRWYGGTEKLKTRSDIVLVDVSNLDVLRHAQMPSKGYGFNIPKGIIELKFRRPNGESRSSFSKKIRADLNKLRLLKKVFTDNQGRCQTEFWMLILDKKEKLPALDCRPYGIRVRYVFSNRSEQDQGTNPLLSVVHD